MPPCFKRGEDTLSGLTPVGSFQLSSEKGLFANRIAIQDLKNERMHD